MNRRVCLVLSALALAACAGSSTVVKTYELIKPVGAPYSRILVVGAHPNAAVRRQVENALVDSLREVQVDAVSSIGTIDPDAQLSRETVSTAAARSHADAVLVSRPQDVRRSATRTETSSTSEEQRDEADSLLAFFQHEYPEYDDPMSLPDVPQIVVTTDLYRTSDNARIWSVESTALEKETLVELLESIAASTSRQLQRDDLVN